MEENKRLIGTLDTSSVDYLLHGLFFNIYGVFKYFPSPIGDIFRVLIFKMFAKKVGKIKIFEGVTLWYPCRVSIENRVTLNEFGGLIIEDDVLTGKGVTISSNQGNDNSYRKIQARAARPYPFSLKGCMDRS